MFSNPTMKPLKRGANAETVYMAAGGFESVPSSGIPGSYGELGYAVIATFEDGFFIIFLDFFSCSSLMYTSLTTSYTVLCSLRCL